jgi:hypothetical protein
MQQVLSNRIKPEEVKVATANIEDNTENQDIHWEDNTESKAFTGKCCFLLILESA